VPEPDFALNFDRSLEVVPGQAVVLSPLVTRVLAPNPGPFTFRGTGVYIIGAGDSVAVIDPGPDMAQHMAALKAVIGARRVSHILITHTHRDHSPAAQPLKEWSGAKTYGFGPHTAALGEVEEGADRDFLPDIVVRDGDVLAGEGFALSCVFTPGHTANHVCYALAQEKALFCGDHVMGWSTSVIAPPDGNMGAYLASLETLRARDDVILYPTHGSPIAQPRAWLEGLLAHRRAREAQVAEALAHVKTPADIAGRLYPDLDVMLRPAATAQVLAHLEHLVEQGRAVRGAAGYFMPG
jgi:glyoxylase-like metal-dependent hydrolase (beta-lactamase superfamily II)